MPVIVSGAVPELVSTTVCALLAIVCVVFAKLKVDAEIVATGIGEATVRVADAELPPPGAGV